MLQYLLKLNKSLRKKSCYIISLLQQRLLEKIPELNVEEWEWFLLGDLFNIKKGKRLTSADQEEGRNNYIGAIDSNNGITNHIGQNPIHTANTISLSYNGSVGEAFYQKDPYWATDDVNALYQFEAIHPFLDGNGRVGRLLIPLYLQSKGIIDKPCLYLSDYIEKNKYEYYDKLSKVRTQNDLIGWIIFSLEAIIETSKKSKQIFKNVVSFTKDMDNEIGDMSVRYENAKKVLEVLYKNPVITRKKLASLTNIKETTLKNVVNNFVEKNILNEITGYSRNQLFMFNKYIDLFQDI